MTGHRELGHDRYESLILNTFLLSGAIVAGSVSIAESVSGCLAQGLFWVGLAAIGAVFVRFHLASIAIFKALYAMDLAPVIKTKKLSWVERILCFVFRSDEHSVWHDVRSVGMGWHIVLQIGIAVVIVGYGIGKLAH